MKWSAWLRGTDRRDESAAPVEPVAEEPAAPDAPSEPAAPTALPLMLPRFAADPDAQRFADALYATATGQWRFLLAGTEPTELAHWFEAASAIVRGQRLREEQMTRNMTMRSQEEIVEDVRRTLEIARRPRAAVAVAAGNGATDIPGTRSRRQRRPGHPNWDDAA